MANETVAKACTLLPADLRRRKDEVRAGLAKKATRVEETGEGYDFLFPRATTIEVELAEFVRFEATCCAFLALEVLAEPEQLRLRMTGDPEAKRFMREELFGAE